MADIDVLTLNEVTYDAGTQQVVVFDKTTGDPARAEIPAGGGGPLTRENFEQLLDRGYLGNSVYHWACTDIGAKTKLNASSVYIQGETTRFGNGMFTMSAYGEGPTVSLDTNELALKLTTNDAFDPDENAGVSFSMPLTGLAVTTDPSSNRCVEAAHQELYFKIGTPSAPAGESWVIWFSFFCPMGQMTISAQDSVNSGCWVLSYYDPIEGADVEINTTEAVGWGQYLQLHVNCGTDNSTDLGYWQVLYYKGSFVTMLNRSGMATNWVPDGSVVSSGIDVNLTKLSGTTPLTVFLSTYDSDIRYRLV